jgi:hypothetical protein
VVRRATRGVDEATIWIQHIHAINSPSGREWESRRFFRLGGEVTGFQVQKEMRAQMQMRVDYGHSVSTSYPDTGKPALNTSCLLE